MPSAVHACVCDERYALRCVCIRVCVCLKSTLRTCHVHLEMTQSANTDQAAEERFFFAGGVAGGLRWIAPPWGGARLVLMGLSPHWVGGRARQVGLDAKESVRHKRKGELVNFKCKNSFHRATPLELLPSEDVHRLRRAGFLYVRRGAARHLPRPREGKLAAMLAEDGQMSRAALGASLEAGELGIAQIVAHGVCSIGALVIITRDELYCLMLWELCCRCVVSPAKTSLGISRNSKSTQRTTVI
jgi:hypothetical protein